MADMFEMFKYIIMVQFFYAIAITLLTHSMPADAINHVTSFSDLGDSIDLQEVSSKVQDSVSDQLDIPVIEIGALIFYSGNIIIDLMLNFFFALPQMVILVLQGVAMMFPGIPTFFMGKLQLFLTGIIAVMYFLGLIQLLTNIRSGGKAIA